MRLFAALAVLAGSVLVGATASVAQSADAAVDAALACRSIKDPSARLACLDKAAAAIAETRIIRQDASPNAVAAPESAPSAVAAQAPAPQPQAAKESAVKETFGSEQLTENQPDRDRRERLEDKIVEAQFGRNNVATLTLANGQVWRQLESDDVELMLSAGKQYTASVKRSLMGGYMLTIKEQKRTIRVRRIQ